MRTDKLLETLRLPPQTDPPRSPRETLPTMYDLPSEDPKEPGLPDEFHYYQPQLLRETFQPPLYTPEHFFVGTDLNLYYYVRRPMWHKRPDWFAVLGVSRLYDEHDLRMSYVIWQEGTAPYLIVELLSPEPSKTTWEERSVAQMSLLQSGRSMSRFYVCLITWSSVAIRMSCTTSRSTAEGIVPCRQTTSAYGS